MPEEPCGAAILSTLPSELEKILATCDKLPSLPEVAIEVLDLCKQDNVALGDLTRCIQKDPALVASILKVVNSAFFGLRTKVGCLSQAVNILGVRKTKVVVLGFSMVKPEQQNQGDRFDIREYWGRAVSTAITAKLLATRIGMPAPEEAFVAGLLQDIGILALWNAMPEEYGRVSDASQQEGGSGLCEVENSLLGTDHARVSAWLLKRWGLPDELTESVAGHHGGNGNECTAAEDQGPTLSAMLQLADAVSLLIWLKQFEQANNLATSNALGLSSEALEEVMLEGLDQYNEIGSAFSLNVSPKISAEEIQQIAREKLTQLALEASTEAERHEERYLQLQRANNELEQEYQEWRKKSKVDLTGLADRSWLQDRLERDVDKGKRVGMMIIDADHLKDVNDTYGHLAGDRALCAMGEIICSQIRGKDLAVRYGGDEFVILLHDLDLHQVIAIAQRIRYQISCLTLEKGERTFKVSVSIGVANSQQFGDGCTYRDLLEAADRSLYNAKTSGRGRVGRPV